MKSKILLSLMFGMILLASAVLAAANVSADYNYTTNWYYNGSSVNNVRAINYVCTSNNCATLGAKLNDINSGSSNSVSLIYPIPLLNSHGYAGYAMAPGYRMMEMGWIPTQSGNSTINASFVKYASCSAPVNSVAANAAVNEGQALSITVSVHSAFHELNEIPYAEPSDADIVQDYLSARTNVTLTIRDSLNNIVYTSSSDNYIREDTNLNYIFSWTPNYAQAGSYTLTATTNVIDTKCASATQVNSVPRALTVNDSPNPDNHAPVLNAIGDRMVMNNTLLQFAITATDVDGDTLTYSASPLPTGALFNPATRTFSWTPTFAQIGNYSVNFSVFDGYLSDSEIITIRVVNHSIDTEAPKYSNSAANPASPAIYAPGAVYTFNATWTDNNSISSVWIVFNGVTYTPIQNGNDYSLVLNDLRPGNYSYQWFANDASGNQNQTSVLVYAVGLGIPSLSIGMLPSSSVDNGTESNVSGLGCPAQLVCKLYRDGAEVSNPDIQTLDIGSYGYIFNTTGNENYTSASITRTLSVIQQGHNDNNNNDNNNNDIIIINDDDFNDGYYVTMNVGDKLKFNFCGSPYYIKLTETDTDDDRAYFLLTPLVETIILNKHQSQEIDLNGDGVKDILFRLESVTSDTARVYIKKISTTCNAVQPSQESGLLVYSDGNKLKPAQEASTGIMSYIAILLMFGILLLALAILLYLIDRMKRTQKKKPLVV
jgi:hypothetical protein